MNHKIVAYFILFIFSFFSINTTLAISKPNYPEITNMIFFGDSLTDIGNNTWISIDDTIGVPITNPNTQNLKFMWPNYLVQKKLNKSVYPSSQMDVSPFTDSISYAYAGAETGEEYNNTNWPLHSQTSTKNPECTQPGTIKDQGGNITSTCNPGLLQQVNLYLKSVQFMPNPKTLFFIWAGSNDLFDYYNSVAKEYVFRTMMQPQFSMTFEPQMPLPSQDKLNALVQKVIHNINSAKEKLIDAGVKPEMIYILTLPDLSDAPALRTSPNWKLTIFFSRENIEKSLSAASQDLNQRLQAHEQNPKYAIPDSHYLQMDKMLFDIHSNPAKYNVTNVDSDCVEKNAMTACTGYLFYDKKHPTTAIHEIIADSIVQKLDGNQD